MTKKEELQVNEEMLYIYSGILFHNRKFAEGNRKTIRYHLDCPEFVQLQEKYKLEEIAGKGGDFQRAKRLLHYLAPRLTHASYYDNHIPCNALDLLEYSFENPEQGINCVNKAKILEECCLALGIYARRMYCMPYSPYDMDNHVVTEIYDRKMQKWIMLDPSSDGYFVNENKIPLSLLEIRDAFANDGFATYVKVTESLKDLGKLREKHMDMNAYICKNLFYLEVDRVCGFGDSEESLCFCPDHYSVKENKIGNVQFRINHIPQGYEEYAPVFQEWLEEAKNGGEPERTNVEVLAAAPCGGE